MYMEVTIATAIVEDTSNHLTLGQNNIIASRDPLGREEKGGERARRAAHGAGGSEGASPDSRAAGGNLHAVITPAVDTASGQRRGIGEKTVRPDFTYPLDRVVHKTLKNSERYLQVLEGLTLLGGRRQCIE